MKKIIIALVALMVALPMMAQEYKIDHDNTDGDGNRMITCELVDVRSFTDKKVFNIGLSGFVYTSPEGIVLPSKSLCIRVNSNNIYTIKKGMLLLIKTIDNEVIQLEALMDGTASRTTNWIGNTPVSTYGTTMVYKISEEQIAMMKKGVTKIRQEIMAGMHEKEFKKKQILRVADIIINHDNLLNEALAEKKSFDSDF